MKVFLDQDLFEPHAHAAKERLDAFRPFDYSQTRNHLQGAVSMLSPYLTHGVLSVPEVADYMYRVHRMGVQHKKGPAKVGCPGRAAKQKGRQQAAVAGVEIAVVTGGAGHAPRCYTHAGLSRAR